MPCPRLPPHRRRPESLKGVTWSGRLARSWLSAAGDGGFSTWSTGWGMDQRIGSGSPGHTSPTPACWRCSTANTRRLWDGRQGSPVRRGVLLWASKLPRPLSRSQALKHVQTPSRQSARIRISWTQSLGVYKSTPRADFSAELLLTQPAVNPVLWFRSRINEQTIFLIVYCLFSRSRLPVLTSPPAPVRIPVFDHSPVPTAALPRFHGSSQNLPRFHGLPCWVVPRSLHSSSALSGKSHGPSFASTQHSPWSRSTARLIRLFLKILGSVLKII